MQPTDVVSFVNEQTKWHVLMEPQAQFGRRGCPVAVLDDGRWVIAEHAESELASKRRALLVGHPAKSPRAATLLDVGARTIETFLDDELAVLRERLKSYEVIGAVDVRALSFEPGTRRLAELGPPQKKQDPQSERPHAQDHPPAALDRIVRN
ncbi:MAG: hypothetical protein ACOY0T_12880 [Myxococcota bacterium]